MRLLLLVFLLIPSLAVAQNAVTPAALTVEPPTLASLGFEWRIIGDDNRDASVAVAYRIRGAGTWRAGLPMLRIGGEQAGTEELAYVTPAMFAGSVLDLEPDTEYECRFTLSDPDGVRGPTVHHVTVRTRAVPEPWPGGRVRHVYPRDWTGPREQPAYEGLLHAYFGYKRFADWNLTGTDPVRPGDTLLVHAGTYRANAHDYRDFEGVTFFGTYELTIAGAPGRPIAIRAAGDGEVIFDGNGAERLFDLSHADHHLIEGLTIRNADVAIFAGSKNMRGPVGLTVMHSRFEDVGIGIHNEYAGSREFYIADNTFIGRHDRTVLVKTEADASGRAFQHVRSYYAVKVAGQGHVIAHNAAAYFFDGFDVSTYGTPDADGASVGIDIYNNDVFAAPDNCIEADGGVHNIRVMRNRCISSAQQPYSFQPLLGGPAYLIRNVAYHTPLSESVKVWGMRGAGVLVYHNTFTGSPSRHDQGASNVHFRNNIFLTQTNTHLPVIAVKTYTSYTTYDYNAYRIVDTRGPAFVWLGPPSGLLRDYDLKSPPLEFQTFEAFRRGTGQERHGITIDHSDLLHLPEPSNQPRPGPGVSFRLYDGSGLDFRLRPSSRAVDAGERLPNVNDDFTGAAPDLGAIESDRPVPTYGPRPR